MLRQVKPRNARSKRALEKRQPQVTENAKSVLFVRGEKCSQIVQLCMADLLTLKKTEAIRFSKKNAIHPFEDASSLEFFSEKNDASLIVFGSHSKKRPHCLTLVRCFQHKVLDMLELCVEAETLRTLSQFKNDKVAVGLKPMLAFSGTAFESPAANAYTLAKSLLLDLFRGQEAGSVDVEGLQLLVHVSVGEETDADPLPRIHLRVFKIITRRSGQRLPRVEVEEIGPRIDFGVGRLREADEAVMKEALKKPRQLAPREKKNVETDSMGDKLGRIHIGRQNLGQLQTRKMKGLKRDRAGADEEMTLVQEDGGAEAEEQPAKRAR